MSILENYIRGNFVESRGILEETRLTTRNFEETSESSVKCEEL